MTVISGLDIASCTGIAWMTLGTPPSKWRAAAIELDGETPEDKAGELALILRKLYRDHTPDFVAIEMPIRAVVRFDKKKRDLAGEDSSPTINPNALQLSALAGAAAATLDLMGIAWGAVAIQTWRRAYYGPGRKPEDGNWKRLALEVAHMQRITLPGLKSADKDAAEAVGVMVAWQSCSQIAQRHQAAFMALRQRQPLPKPEVSHA
jgi:hypothetical protein